MKKFISKRVVSAVLAAGIALSGTAAVNADTDYEGVISRVRECFDLPEDLSDVNISQYGESVNISWSDENGRTEYNASADEHGCITGFYSYSDEQNGERKLGRDEAKAVADKMLKSLYGSHTADIVYEGRNISRSSISLNYSVAKYGVPVDVSISVTVNRITGMISGFNGPCSEVFDYDYTDPRTVKLLDGDEIYENYKNTENIALIYNIFYNYTDRTKNVKPVYRLKPKDIDAVSGATINAETAMYSKDAGDADMEMAAEETTAASGRVTPAERQAIEDFKNLISKEDADAAIKKHFPELKKAEVSNTNVYRDYWDKKAVRDLSYEIKDESGEEIGYAYASVNAETGEILGYHYSNWKYYSDCQNKN